MLLALGLCLLPALLRAQEVHRAGVVVAYGDGRVETACVSFDEPQISGYDLLQRSGLTVESLVSGMGASVCRIGEVGCSQSDCFCQCRGGGDCVYWSYWHHQDGDWSYSSAGSGAFMIAGGALEGWSWGPGSVTQAIAPPPMIFADVCAAPQASTMATFAGAAETAGRPAVSWPAYAALAFILAGLGALLWRGLKGSAG